MPQNFSFYMIIHFQVNVPGKIALHNPLNNDLTWRRINRFGKSYISPPCSFSEFATWGNSIRNWHRVNGADYLGYKSILPDTGRNTLKGTRTF